MYIGIDSDVLYYYWIRISSSSWQPCWVFGIYFVHTQTKNEKMREKMGWNGNCWWNQMTMIGWFGLFYCFNSIKFWNEYTDADAGLRNKMDHIVHRHHRKSKIWKNGEILCNELLIISRRPNEAFRFWS